MNRTKRTLSNVMSFVIDGLLDIQEYLNLNRNRNYSELFPDKDSEIKLYRYSISCHYEIELGKPCDFEMKIQPDTNLRVDGVIMNAPAANFAFIRVISAANIICSMGTTDAYEFSKDRVSAFNMPTMTPANTFRVIGYYKGEVPPGFISGNKFTLSVTFHGNASLIA